MRFKIFLHEPVLIKHVTRKAELPLYGDNPFGDQKAWVLKTGVKYITLKLLAHNVLKEGKTNVLQYQMTGHGYT